MITKFKCSLCGKITAGRIPRQGRQVGDLTVRWPRKHKSDNKYHNTISQNPVCRGSFLPAEWVDMDVTA